MKLNQLQPAPGSTKAPIRVGRGIGSGKGKTCGRGVKGQKSRTGVAIKGFEGGQQPIARRLPKRGFKNIFRVEQQVINLATLQKLSEEGLLKKGESVTRDALKAVGAIKNAGLPIKILAKGELKVSLTVEADAVSSSAVRAIEKAGGKVILPVQSSSN